MLKQILKVAMRSVVWIVIFDSGKAVDKQLCKIHGFGRLIFIRRKSFC